MEDTLTRLQKTVEDSAPARLTHSAHSSTVSD